MIKVIVAGAAGRMGQEVVKAILDDKSLSLAGTVDVCSVGKSLGEVVGVDAGDIKVRDDLGVLLRDSGAEVMVDFTHSDVVMENIRTALTKGVHVVVGTTGITDDNLCEIKTLAKDSAANAFIAPNFAIGAVLAMKFSEKAAEYLPDVEIIELHHKKKADAPSGTSILTAKLISDKIKGKKDELKESIKGVRGGLAEKVRVHSVRLPGLVAHQETIFGGQGQTLTIRHDSIDRTSFMPGVIMAIKCVGERSGLTHGLDKILDL